MAIITYRRPACPNCQHYLRTGWPKFGPAQVKCGYCGTILRTGLAPWATLSTGRRVLIAIWELLLPTLGGNPGVNLLFSPLAWASLIGIPLLVLRLVLMISQSDAYSRTGLPPTWKYMSTLVPSIGVPAPDSPGTRTDRASKRADTPPEPAPSAGIVDQSESLTPQETSAGSAPAVHDAAQQPTSTPSEDLPLSGKPAHPVTSVAQIERQDQPAKHVSEVRSSPSHKPRAKGKASIILVGAVALLAVCVLLPVCMVAALMLLSPAMSNTFSNTNAGLNPVQPKPEINTSVGALVVLKIESAGSLPPGCSSGPTCSQPKDADLQFLVLWLERKDSGRMKDIKDGLFKELRDNPGKAYVITSDGYRAELAEVFFGDPGFALGFVVPITTTGGITLNWPNNRTIALANPLGGSLTASSPAFTGRITPAPPPTTAPIVHSGLAQPGHWEGSPGVSFEVTADGKIRDFRLAASDVQCILQIEELAIKPDGTFELVQLIEERNYWPGADRDALKTKNVWPTPVMTEKGAMIEERRINGKLLNATAMSGSYNVLVCGDRQLMLAPGREPMTWTAEWRGTAPPTSAPNVTVTPKSPPTAMSTSTRIAPSPKRTLPKTGLSEASAKGKVKFTIFGNGLETINVTLELTDEEPMEVTIPPGTVFQAMSGRVQNMVVRLPRTVALMSRGAKETVEVQVACANMHLDQPTSSDAFTIRKESTDPDLLTLLALPDFPKEDFQVQQFAIWTITDNPSRNGYVGLGNSYSLYGTSPSTDEFQRIRTLFDKAGISASKYQAFRSLTLPPTLSSMQPTTATPAPMVTPAATALPAAGLHCDNPNAQITSPGMNQKIRGIVPFMGSANIPDFLYYKIQFMPEASYGTDKWGQLYQAKTPVPPTGKLMEWHTYTVEPGRYWLRLIVADHTGNYPDPCEIRVQVER